MHWQLPAVSLLPMHARKPRPQLILASYVAHSYAPQALRTGSEILLCCRSCPITSCCCGCGCSRPAPALLCISDLKRSYFHQHNPVLCAENGRLANG